MTPVPLPTLKKHLDFSSPGAMLRRAWKTLGGLPGGRRVFDQIMARVIPYTGTVAPEFLELRPGYARVAMNDRRAVRNHLRSVHAVALANLGEASTGMALACGLPPEARAILVKLTMEYRSKARGRLTAECRCEPPRDATRQEVELTSELRNEQGEIVAICQARWLVSPRPAPRA